MVRRSPSAACSLAATAHGDTRARLRARRVRRDDALVGASRRSWSTTRSRSRRRIRSARSTRPRRSSTARSTTRSSPTTRATSPLRSRCSCSRGRRSNGAKTFTFQLKKNVHFADGTPLTSADVVFSLNRLINLKGNPAFLLAGITVSAHGKYTVVMTSKTPATQLPAILANPSTGIVNSKLVKAHGGTAAANARQADKAEQWLNSSASAGAGSGPYTLKSYSTTSQVTLVPNTKYWGAKKPAFGTVVVRNMIAPTQLINVQRGSHEVAIDLSADQAQTLKGNSNVHVVAAAVDVGLLALREQRPAGLGGHVEQAVPDRRSATRSTTSRSCRSPARARSRRRA